MNNKNLIEAATPANAGQQSSKKAQPINRRIKNRSLNTENLLALLRREAPKFYELAEVVGKWVWVQLNCEQSAPVVSALCDLGFHWSSNRQAWQHPCGTFCEGVSKIDPRTKYGSYFAADQKPA